MFLTNDAVKLVKESWFAEATSSCDSVVVCEASWVRYAVTDSAQDSAPNTAQFSAGHCPVETGSQTSNSEMTGRARRVVSL